MWGQQLYRLSALWSGTHCGVWTLCCGVFQEFSLPHWSSQKFPCQVVHHLISHIQGTWSSWSVFISMPFTVMLGWGALLFGARWKWTSVFPRLMVRPNSFKASENLFGMVCRSLDLCAMSAQSSANSAAWIRSVRVFDLTVSWQCWTWNHQSSSRYTLLHQYPVWCSWGCKWRTSWRGLVPGHSLASPHWRSWKD